MYLGDAIPSFAYAAPKAGAETNFAKRFCKACINLNQRYGDLQEQVSKAQVNTLSTCAIPGMSNSNKQGTFEGETAMWAIVIVAALSFVGLMGYFFYLTPGPDDQI